MQPPGLAVIAPQQVVISRLFKIQPPRPEHRKSFSRHAASFSPSFNLPLCAFGDSRLADAYFSCSKRTRHECPAREISTQNHAPHIAMRSNPTIAWKASLTRTPPPICTSAPFPKPRWSQEPWAPRTLLEIHHALFPATEMIRRWGREKHLCVRETRWRLLWSTARG